MCFYVRFYYSSRTEVLQVSHKKNSDELLNSSLLYPIYKIVNRKS